MRFSYWFGRKVRSVKKSCRLRVDHLENRDVPTTLLRPPPGTLVPGAATHFQVFAPASVEAGQPFAAVVEAEDAHNLVVPNYTGTVHFSLATTFAGASLPANFTFTAACAGVHAFTVTLSNAGNDMLEVADTKTGITGKTSTHVVQQPTHFAIITPTTITQGVPTTITVEALNAHNQVVTGYAGTVSFFSTDSFASLPTSYTFQASDKGIRQFTATFGSFGLQSLAVGDVANPAIAGSIEVSVAFNPLFIPSFSFLNGWGWNWGWKFW